MHGAANEDQFEAIPGLICWGKGLSGQIAGCSLLSSLFLFPDLTSLLTSGYLICNFYKVIITLLAHFARLAKMRSIQTIPEISR